MPTPKGSSLLFRSFFVRDPDPKGLEAFLPCVYALTIAGRYIRGVDPSSRTFFRPIVCHDSPFRNKHRLVPTEHDVPAPTPRYFLKCESPRVRWESNQILKILKTIASVSRGF